MLARHLSVTRTLLVAGLLTAALALTGCYLGGHITAAEGGSESFPAGAAPRAAAERPDGPFATGHSGASFILSVPAGATRELRTSNGQITAFGVTGDVDA